MAILADLVATKGTAQLAGGLRADAVILPPVNVFRISAAGFADMVKDAEVYLFHNLAASQTVYIRLNLDSDNTAAADGDSQSIRVDPGETFAFGLAVETDAGGYKLSVT